MERRYRLTEPQERKIRRTHENAIAHLARARQRMQEIVRQVVGGENIRTARGQPSKKPEADADEELFEILTESEQAASEHIRGIERLRAALDRVKEDRKRQA